MLSKQPVSFVAGGNEAIAVSCAQQQELLPSGNLALECMTCRLLGCLCMHVNGLIYFLNMSYYTLCSPYAEMCSSEQALESAPDNDVEGKITIIII